MGSIPTLGTIKTNNMDYTIINKLVLRLQKIGINIELESNYPWIYLSKVNGNTIKEDDYYQGNHGFTIAFYPIKKNQQMKFTNITELFKVIRKYRGVEQLVAY